MSKFKKTNNLEKRKQLYRRCADKYTDRIPIICEKAPTAGNDVPNMNSCKFLVDKESTVAQFMANIRSRMTLNPGQALFLFVGNQNIIPPGTARLEELYEKHKDEDGFLYFVYSGENAFGCIFT